MRRIGSSTRKRAKERLCATHDSPNLCRRFFYFKALFSYSFILLYLAALVSLHFHKKTTDTVVFRLELLPGFEAEADTPDHTEIYITEVCKLLKQYSKMLTFYELYMRGFDNAEIAEAMGIAQGNVSHYLQRLGKRLFKLKGDILPIIEQYGEIDCTRFYDMERQERHTKGRNAPKTDDMPDDEYKRIYGASALWKRKNAERRKEYNREYYARRKIAQHADGMSADGRSLRRRAHTVGVLVPNDDNPQFSHTLDNYIPEHEQTKKHNMLYIPCFLGGGDSGTRTRLPQGGENADRE